MAGYDGFSKSNNAVAAEEDGRFPASVVARNLRVPIDAVRAYESSEYHHTSKFFSKTDYYDQRRVAGWLLMSVEGQQALREACAEAKAARQSTVYDDCRVEWLEWSVTRAHPKATEMKADGCRVEVRGQTATITLPSGETLRKRLSCTGLLIKTEKGLL